MAVEGLDATLRKMRRVPGLVIAEVRKAMEKAATDMVRQMRAVAPRDSGTLAASIDWTWGAAPKGSMAIGTVSAGGSGSGGLGDLSITIYAGGKLDVASVNDTAADAFYARFQEFGTRKMPANPFFFPVYRANRSRARGAMSRAIRKAIRDA